MGSNEHAWGEDRILTHLPAAKILYDSIYKNNPSIKIPPPRFISVWCSEKCNLDCGYCFFSDTNHDKSHTYIDTHQFLNWLGVVKELGSESLEFSGGGEPTLHPDFQMIYEHAANMLGYKIGVITHACNDMPIESMVNHFKYVRCGLDAATAETHDLIKRNKRKNYWFHRAIENIKNLVELRNTIKPSGFSVGVKVVLNTVNADELADMIDLAISLDTDYIQIKHEHSSDHALTPERLEILQALIDFKSLDNESRRTQVKGTMSHARATVKCFMSPIHTVVTATGKILQCCFFENRPIGTIFQPFSEVWGNDQHRKVIEKTTVKECSTVDCRWNFYNSKMKEVIEDPLAQASFI